MIAPAECDQRAGQSPSARATPKGLNPRGHGATMVDQEDGVEVDEVTICEDEASQSAEPDAVEAQRADQDPCVDLDPCADQDLSPRP
jgi:hypothetical protein